MRFLSLFLVGCFPATPIDFGDPALLGPLEDQNLAASPVLGEGLTMASGQRPDGIFWAHARGILGADAADVWEALRIPEVMADRREVNEFTFEENILPEFDFSYVLHNTVRQPVTINFDLTWVHELQEGDIGTPDEVVLRWDKTDGTPFIRLISGSIVITRLDDRTELSMIEHLDTARSDEQVLVQYLNDLFGDIEATLAGDPLPDLERD